MDLGSAITTEGPLEKQSPSLIKIFQSRYFAIRGKGEYLVWFKKKPKNPDQNPKGIINIDTITDVRQSQEDDRIMHVEYLERVFTLRAETVAVRDRWVNALRTILAHHRKLNKNRNKNVMKSSESWKWDSNFNKEVSEQIRLENEEAILLDDGDNKLQRSEGLLAHFTSDESVFDIEKCLVYGFFLKKGLITNTERWFFLSSEVNLKDEKDEQFYNLTQKFFDQLSLKNSRVQTKQQAIQEKKKRKYSDSSEDEEEQKEKERKQEQKASKTLKINILYEYDEENKQLKHYYNLQEMVSFELNTSEEPFSLKIVYEETINEEEEEIRENQVTLLSNYLSQIRKLETALRIINEKYSIQKHREIRNANKSKKFPAKKWKFAEEDTWRVPGEKLMFPLMINQKQIKLNANSINLENVLEFKREEISIKEEDEEGKEKVKKEAAFAISFKSGEQSKKIYIQFEKPETETKFNKKLTRNMKKVKEEVAAQNSSKPGTHVQEKKINPNTYLIDKKIRETNSSIKVNFYELMEREVIPEKTEPNKSEGKGFWASFMGMFCGGPSENG